MKILVLFGTRPEAIKMAPVVKSLEGDVRLDVKVCVTAQHRQMLDQVLELFDIKPDYDLDIMSKNQDLYDVTSRVLLGVRDVLKDYSPDLVLVHGDTTSCFAGSLAAFYAGVPVGHVEAGLRTGDLSAPFPEEANRVLTGRLTSLHFAPTEKARQNLLDERVDNKNIFVTGNTVIDSLLWVREKVADEQSWSNDVFGSAKSVVDNSSPFVLITGHRRENFGTGFLDICSAISELADSHSHVHFIYPVHLNPQVQEPVYSLLGEKDNIHLIDPLDYAPFVYLMDKCTLILTDSGGIQEEAPSLGKPVLVMRNTTERPEALEAGTVVLVGTDKEKIIQEVEKVVTKLEDHNQNVKTQNPYGDGNAATRIKDVIIETVPSIRTTS